MSAEMSNVTPINHISRSSLMTLREAELHAMRRALLYLWQTDSNPSLIALSEIVGMSRHATKRRMDKYGLLLKAPVQCQTT
jgi:hypothetical protein